MRLSAGRALATALLAAGAFALAGCDEESDSLGPYPTPSPTTQFTGVFAGGADGGRVDVTLMTEDLAPAKPGAGRTVGRVVGSGRVVGTGLAVTRVTVVALATLSPTGGGTANLTGTYDSEADTLNLSGSGYAMRAIRTGSSGSPELMGSILGPSGTAGMRCAVDGGAETASYCALYESNSTSLTGRLNFLISGTDIAGVAVVEGASAGAWVDGTASGSGATRNLVLVGGFPGGQTISATGLLTVATGDVFGNWTLRDGVATIDSGTWIGDECLAGTTGSQ